MSSSRDAMDTDGEMKEASASSQVGAIQIASNASTPPPPPQYTNPYSAASAGSQHQFPFLDPNVMMMTNAAATIAAVAASAVQQMAQGNGTTPPGSTSASAVPAPPPAPPAVPPGLVAALQNSGKSLVPSHSSAPHVTSSLPSHFAALLSSSAPTSQLPFQTPAVGGGGGAASLSRIPPPLSQPDTPPPLHPSAAPPAAMTPGPISNILLPGMQTWSLDQLEQHVALLQQLNQPVPQSVALLLADARRKEKKRTAKRVANRKSAHTSRARKKALVEEMTRTNARLKRQALILALLPDLVVAITVTGEITFCSDQVERVLQHKIDDLLGANLQSLLAPVSRDALAGLIKGLTSSGKHKSSRGSQANQARRSNKRRHADQRTSSDATASKATNEGNGNGNSNVSGRGSSRSGGRSGGETSAAAVVSEQSFPLSVVEVESKQSASGSRPGANGETIENSDTSTSNSGGKNPVSSLTNSTSLSRSPTASSGEDDRGSRRHEAAGNQKRLPSSDDSSSLSSDAKNMRKANDNLDRNVRWHNQRMMEENNKKKADNGPKDDVTGASVTANNASARLSSLKHVPEHPKAKDDKSSRYENAGDQSSSDDSLLAGVEEKKKAGENASDDSGYRESNDSREETSSSGSDSSNSNDRRKKPLAPTCRMCLIKKDLTTVWCEVTSSIRTRTSEEDVTPEILPVPKTAGKPQEPVPVKKVEKELLLCLRPVRDGEKKVDESLRFVAPRATGCEESVAGLQRTEVMVSTSSGEALEANVGDHVGSVKTTTESESKSYSGPTSSRDKSKRPPKKRLHPNSGDILATTAVDEMAKRSRPNTTAADELHESSHASDEKSVVESLMLMNKSQ